MNKQSGSNRAASARPQQCILPEFSPLVLGGAPQPPTPATSLLELCSGRHHHLLLLLGSQSLLHLLLAGGSQLHTQLPALLQCVCVWRTEAPYNKTGQGKRIWIKVCNLPPWNLLITPSRAPSIISRTSFTHATHTIITSTQQYGKRSHFHTSSEISPISDGQIELHK